MDNLLTTIPAHYDGETIRLDVPIHLEPNTRLLVTVLDPAHASSELVYDLMAASTASYSQVWDNDEDAVYDAY
jgi:hypothetical protein